MDKVQEAGLEDNIVTRIDTLESDKADTTHSHSEFITAQFLPYSQERVYTTGEICYTKDQATDELSYWQWYSNVESLAGKSPLLATNRHTGWSDNTKPFYWVPYTGDQVGMPCYWLDTTAPEWAVMEINVDLPIVVYWRLARRYPDLVTGSIINTGEIRAEFLRVLDQGRGVDSGRQLNTHQNGSLIALNDNSDGQVYGGQNANAGQLANDALSFDDATLTGRTGLSNTSFRYYAGTTRTLPVVGIPFHSGVTRPTNVARPMAIVI